MTRHEQILAALTPAARTALVAVGTNRQGATLRQDATSAVANELGARGLIGLDGGLSRTGTIVRQYLVDQELEF